jgi:hypothetical protein
VPLMSSTFEALVKYGREAGLETKLAVRSVRNLPSREESAARIDFDRP